MNWLFAIIPLTDFDETFGPLLVSPGSHKLTKLIDPQAAILDLRAPDREQLPPFVDPELKAGDPASVERPYLASAACWTSHRGSLRIPSSNTVPSTHLRLRDIIHTATLLMIL